jgi:hypothetical protein
VAAEGVLKIFGPKREEVKGAKEDCTVKSFEKY